MELKENTPVFSAEGEKIGKINRFVINPVSKKVTHIVVEKGQFTAEDTLVPIEWVASAQVDQVSLKVMTGDIQKLPPFEEIHFVNTDESEWQRLADQPHSNGPLFYSYPPFGESVYTSPYFQPNLATETERNIPENTIALEDGAEVISAEGDHIGNVERVFVHPKSKRATHFLISQGLLLKERKLVPVSWVSAMEEGQIRLAVGKNILERLPVYQP